MFMMEYSFLEYIRLKAIVSALRVTVSWNSTPPQPDDSYTLKSRDGKRDIRVNVYHSKSPASPQPVVLNWYGGGFVLPGHGTDDLFCRRVANHTVYTLLDASYALGPENPFPTALEDVRDLIMHVLQQPEQFDANNIVLSGFSSGANLALVAAANSASFDIPGQAIRAVSVFYPPTDFTIPRSEKKAPDGSVSTIPPVIANALRAAYMPLEADPADPRLSVIKADPESFPNDVLIFTAEKDVLAKEAEELAANLVKTGKRVVSKRFNGVAHGWDKTKDENSNDAKERDVAYDMVLKFLSDLNN
jgi:acetyl esterase/lipase